MNAKERPVALVTGGTRGIGLAIARVLGISGHQLVMTYASDDEQADRAVDELHDASIPAQAHAVDVSDRDAVKELFAQLKRDLSPPLIVVNNAGVLTTNYVRFMKPDEWRRPLEVSLDGAFYVTQAATRGMMRAKWGRIINIASDAGLMGDAMRASYASAKAGLLGLTKTTARELAQMQITVNAVAPGLIDTRMTSDMDDTRRDAQRSRIPMRRFGSPTEVANVVAFLASDDAAFITGQTICVDGGLWTGG